MRTFSEDSEELIVIDTRGANELLTSATSSSSSADSPPVFLLEYKQTVPIARLGHFFIPFSNCSSPAAAASLEMEKNNNKFAQQQKAAIAAAAPQIEVPKQKSKKSNGNGGGINATATTTVTGSGGHPKAKRQHKLATSSSIVFDQSQHNRIQITHQNYMSIVDFSPTTPPCSTPKFPLTNTLSPVPPAANEFTSAPPAYTDDASSKIVGIGGKMPKQSRQCFDEKSARSCTELLMFDDGEDGSSSMGQQQQADGGQLNSSVDAPDALESAERETWERKIDFLLSVVGFAVDLANVWRFPYLCFKNGGGAFLIPYTLMVLLAGIPLFYMELALGQFHRKGAITTWGKICPLFKGIGYCVIMTAFYTDFFYNVIIAFALHYFYASFTTQLPWSRCSSVYNSPACYEPSWSDETRQCKQRPVYNNELANNSADALLALSSSTSSSLVDDIVGDKRPVSAAEEYFYKHFLGLHAVKEPVPHVQQSIDELGTINWEIMICLFVVYLICYFSLWKGIKMSGKVVWFTAIFPYVVLVCLLIRGITLPGSEKGIEYYLSPNLEKLKDPSVWQDAATQVFFSLGPGFGVLMAYSSYNEFHNNVYFDALLTSTINCGTSFLAGFVIFSVLGYMSCKSGKPIEEVAQEGPGLVFVVYPEALSTMPGATIWSLIFFLMLLTLGLDSSFGGSEAIITGLSDEFPVIKRNREIFVAALFTFYMFIGITMCTQGGMLVMEWLIVYGTTWGLLIAVFCETMVISFCYGIQRFCSDIREMLGFEPGWYWRVCWTIAAPIFLIAMILSSFINLQPLQYQDYVYPPMANMLGIIFALSSVSAIPLVALWVLVKEAKGDTILERFRYALRPVARENRVGHVEYGNGRIHHPEMIRANRVTFTRVNGANDGNEKEGGMEDEDEQQQFLQAAEHGDVLL